MTRQHAMDAALEQAFVTGVPSDVWEHTGSPKVPMSGRFLNRPSDANPPKWGWTKRATVMPDGHIQEPDLPPKDPFKE